VRVVVGVVNVCRRGKSLLHWKPNQKPTYAKPYIVY
jgi:hypothetical protein